MRLCACAPCLVVLLVSSAPGDRLQASGAAECGGCVATVPESIIEGAGTGMYFGNSDGEDELAHSLIEHNLVVDTIGYNVQIKHLVGNAVFGDPLDGGTQLDNAEGNYAAAGNDLTNPDGVLTGASDRLDFFPLPGRLEGPVDTTGLGVYEDSEHDFNAAPRSTSFRGAYGGSGFNPGWLPALERQPELSIFADGFESGDTSRWSDG